MKYPPLSIEKVMDMKVRKIRLLRHMFGITCKELGKASGLSAQRESQIELCEEGISDATMIKLQTGFEKIILDREKSCKELASAYARHKDTLFDLVMENDYEL